MAVHQLLQESRNTAIPQPVAGPTKLLGGFSLDLLDHSHLPSLFYPTDRFLDCLANGNPAWLSGVCPWADTAISTCSASIHLQSGLPSYKVPRCKLVDRYMCGAGHYETALRSSCDADVPAPGAGHTSSMRSNRRLLRANRPCRGDVGRDSMTVLARRGGITLSCSLARRLEMDLCGEYEGLALREG